MMTLQSHSILFTKVYDGYLPRNYMYFEFFENIKFLKSRHDSRLFVFGKLRVPYRGQFYLRSV